MQRSATNSDERKPETSSLRKKKTKKVKKNSNEKQKMKKKMKSSKSINQSIHKCVLVLFFRIIKWNTQGINQNQNQYSFLFLFLSISFFPFHPIPAQSIFFPLHPSFHTVWVHWYRMNEVKRLSSKSGIWDLEVRIRGAGYVPLSSNHEIHDSRMKKWMHK